MIDEGEADANSEESPAHLLSIVSELSQAASGTDGYDLEAVKRIAQLILRAPGVTSIDDAIARAKRYEKGPSMFGRAVRMELERIKNNAGAK